MVTFTRQPKSPPPTWRHVSHPAANRGILHVYAQDTDPPWDRMVIDYWLGRIPALETVRKHKWGGRVERIWSSDHGTHCYVKRFKPASLRFWHKVFRARHTIRQETRLRSLGFSAPETVCLVERRVMGILVESAVVSLELDEGCQVSRLLNEADGKIVASLADKRAMLRHVAREVARWHNAGLFHGDLHLGNIAVQKDNQGFRFHWFDHEEGHLYKRLPYRKRVHDLNHVSRQPLPITVSDRFRMWQAYLQTTQLPPRVATALLYDVARKSRKFWQKKMGLP